MPWGFPGHIRRVLLIADFVVVPHIGRAESVGPAVITN